MILNGQDFLLINELIRNPETESRFLSDRLDLTRRQIDYSIRKINQYLVLQKVPELQREADGRLRVLPQTQELLVNVLEAQKKHLYIPTEPERVQMIILSLLSKWREDPSLLDLADLTGVSRNTVSNDLKAVNDLLDAAHLQLTYSRTGGYEIEGDEIELRRLLVRICGRFIRMYNADVSYQQLTGIDLEPLQHALSRIETTYGLHFSDEGYRALTLSLALTLRRIERGHVLMRGHLPIADEDLADAPRMLTQMPLTQSDCLWLKALLLTTNVVVDKRNREDPKLRDAVSQFIDAFEKRSLITITDRENFIDRILIHIRPALLRITLDMPAENVLASTVADNYRALYSLVEDSLQPLETYVGKHIPAEEAAFMTMYVGGELLRQGTDIVHRNQALVVCNSGLATSEMLMLSLREVFPDLTFIGAVSRRQFSRYDGHVDVVFSTVPIQADCPVFVVDPIMSPKDKSVLYNRVVESLNLKDRGSRTERLLRLIRKHALVFDEASLRSDLDKELSGISLLPEVSTDLADQKELSSYIRLPYIQVGAADGWEQAIRMACGPLETHGIIRPEYTDALVNAAEDPVTYSFLGPHVAIPHLDRDDLVLGDGFGLLILDHPVRFIPGLEIRAVIPIAIRNKQAHFRAIMQLHRLAEDEERLNQLLNTRDVDAIHALIRES